ncbi:unnamed protein product, partial [Ilex paraguariensis]
TRLPTFEEAIRESSKSGASALEQEEDFRGCKVHLLTNQASSYEESAAPGLPLETCCCQTLCKFPTG